MQYFIKNHHHDNESLIKEVEGLKQLSQVLNKYAINELSIPQIIDFNAKKLTLENIQTQNATSTQMQQFALGLAKLHTVKFKQYGLAYNNFIGLNIQKNRLFDDWGSFFADYRLAFQIDLIEESTIRTLFKKVLINNRYKLINYLNSSCEHASLVHGDLWSGNVLFSKQSIYLIDPAIYYADREVDIAMSEMFGGFTHDFYDTYDKSLPLSENYHDKKIIYNLYHYLNHFNLFGDSYLHECEEGFSFIEKL